VRCSGTTTSPTTSSSTRSRRPSSVRRELGVPLGAWLTTVARNFAFRLRRTARRRLRRERERARARARTRTGATSDPAAALTRFETQRRVADAVHALDEPFRTAVLLRYFEELSPAEIAARTGVPAATARTRVKRGVDRLRRRLDREHGEDGRAWRRAMVPLALVRRRHAAALGVLVSKKAI
jgi:RNA polymerase sigma-70 factor (ECF subfamily)